MKPDQRFLVQPPRFWANVKLVSEQVGYSQRGPSKALRRYSIDDISRVYAAEGLDPQFTQREAVFFERVVAYLNVRADVIENRVQHLLMNKQQAAEAYSQLVAKLRSSRRPSMNKQSGEKRHPAYLSCMVSLIAESVLGETGFIDDARRLSVISIDGVAERTFSRRFDGAMPTVANPRAVWEVKEYYGTTTFGSRVADGVYETLLDGHEINEAEGVAGRRVKHFLFVDDHYTWWDCGRSYLCRIVDMLHSGHVDEVFFGREVLTEWEPALRQLLMEGVRP